MHEIECPHGWWGFYDPDWHVVGLRPRLGPVQRASTLAHELGHAFFRHRGSHFWQEESASNWAVGVLIDPAEFESAIRVFDSVTAVAHELNVLPRDVRRYAKIWQKNRADNLRRCYQDTPFQPIRTQLSGPGILPIFADSSGS